MKRGRPTWLCLPGLLLSCVWCTTVLAAGSPATASLEAGDLQLVVEQTVAGVTLHSLNDTRVQQEFLAHEALPLSAVTLQRVGATNRARLTAKQGWRRCTATRRGKRLELDWAEPADATLAGVSLTAEAKADPEAGALRWSFRVETATKDWSVWRVAFPQLALADLGTNGAVLFARGPGEVQRGVWERAFNFEGTYPSSGCAMQFMAAYREGDPPTGLYVATHDPWASTKELSLRSDPPAHAVQLEFAHPAPDMGVGGNGFTLEGEAVWQILRGDWFDAAMIYRNWAQRQAKWWPRLGRDGRTDTPRWMRELNVWAMTGGGPGDCVPSVKAFRQFLDLPVGFHWYNWHQIPFDNDYPHYFPAKDGFERGVAELQSAGVYVMPYINGRLWDSHDRRGEDFEFTSRALAAVTKHEDGSPYLESYGSKETNGQPVRLGVMCPTMALWQNTVSNIVLRLLRQCGTRAVYIDQIAAAPPTLCFDRTHGHPLGGGHWWTEGYWKMLDAIRKAKPPETVLTRECNGEPFIRWFDGYLTWHWQHEGQVPAFPAIYGGTIQMFGRAYRGGATKNLALRMKAGQQLVFGEQLGWIDPGVVRDPENAEFFRQVVQLRGKFNRYFSVGQMVRPPHFLAPIPQVRADWQWSGEWWVTTDAVLTGAWTVPSDHRLALLFVNVSDSPVMAGVRLESAAWGLPPRGVRCEVTATSSEAALPPDTGGSVALANFGPRQAQVWEFKW